MGSVEASDERYRTITKSSMTSANTRTALAKMAGYSSGRRTRRRAWVGDAPRSMAASSYSLPIDNSRARTMMAGYEIWKVIRPSS